MNMNPQGTWPILGGHINPPGPAPERYSPERGMYPGERPYLDERQFAYQREEPNFVGHTLEHPRFESYNHPPQEIPQNYEGGITHPHPHASHPHHGAPERVLYSDRNRRPSKH
jgi:hypothetical protein